MQQHPSKFLMLVEESQSKKSNCCIKAPLSVGKQSSLKVTDPCIWNFTWLKAKWRGFETTE